MDMVQLISPWINKFSYLITCRTLYIHDPIRPFRHIKIINISKDRVLI